MINIYVLNEWGIMQKILVSLASDITDTPSIDSNWEIFKTLSVENETWGHYDFFLYSKFKAHWINGVKMFVKYGQHDLAHNSCTVCVGQDDFDFTELLRKFRTVPPNTIVFNELKSANREHVHVAESHAPGPIPIAFVTSYSSFMKLVSLWKWIDSYDNEPHILDTDNTYAIMRRTMWQRNIQYTSMNWKRI